MISLSHTLRSRKKMKRNSICKSSIMLIMVLVASFFFALVLSGIAASKIEPAGTNIGAVQFDAVIELNRYSPRSSRHSYTLIFARYWVARGYYSAAVVWAEPQSTDLYFALHPSTLTVTSNKQRFSIGHEIYSKYNQKYEKPLGKRGVLRNKFGSYPIPNVRFAEQEALATRLYTTDIRGLEDANKTGGEMLDISIPASEDCQTRDVAKLKVKASDGYINSMQLFNVEQQLLKNITYEYESYGGKTHLRRQNVVLPERPMMVGFKGEGMKVTLNGKEYRYRDLQATHHRGGRRCSVEYEPVMLGDREVPLPVQVIVRNGKDGRILRCVRLMNFKRVELDAAGAEKAAKQFSGFNADQCKYREFRSKYWKKDPTEVEKTDAETIGQILARIEKDASATGNSTGEKLKHLNILMELNRIVGDESELERYYQQYLSTLKENKLLQMTLVGGYGVIETSMFRGGRSEAEKLLGRWVNAILDINDAESILLFARRQLAKKRLWTTVKLLESYSAKYHSRISARFEAEVLRCTALGELCKLLSINDIDKKGLIAKVQTDWVASINQDDLETMLTDSMEQAGRSFEGLPEPSESQQVLKVQLDKIGKEIKQANNQ